MSTRNPAAAAVQCGVTSSCSAPHRLQALRGLFVCSKKGKGKVVEVVAPTAAAAPEAEDLGKEVDSMPQFASFGTRFRSCKGVRATEEDTEYLIFCVKHIYDAHILLQFNCTNTIADQVPL
jgi:coatomer subunit gamma